MKTKYVILLVVLMILLVAGFLVVKNRKPVEDMKAQRPHAEGRAHHMRGMALDSTQIAKNIDDLDAALSLSDEQKEEITTLYTAHSEKIKGLREENDGDRHQMMESMKGLHDELSETISAVLDEDQQEKYVECLKKQAEKRPGRGGRRGPKE